MPLAFDNVALVPAVVELIVTRFPAVPVKLKFETVCVVLAGNVTVVG